MRSSTVSILISAAVRLAAFNIPQYAAMTAKDDMDFGSLGERKRAIFCVIPINDASMNYLIGMLYTQCFQELYYRADEKYNGRLPVPVRVIQDEWANVAQPDSYPKILATCRSYNIGLNIIVQNIQNIKALCEKEREGSWTEKILHITITGKTAAEMVTEYGFTAQQMTAVDELLAQRDMLEELIGNLTAISADATDIIRNLPADLSPERRAVIKTACSLVGKVNYFWGGKSLVMGWDS